MEAHRNSRKLKEIKMHNTAPKLWAYRTDPAYGWRWHLCREVSPHEADQWMGFFQKDEPNTKFVVAVKKPRIIK